MFVCLTKDRQSLRGSKSYMKVRAQDRAVPVAYGRAPKADQGAAHMLMIAADTAVVRALC